MRPLLLLAALNLVGAALALLVTTRREATASPPASTLPLAEAAVLPAPAEPSTRVLTALPSIVAPAASSVVATARPSMVAKAASSVAAQPAAGARPSGGTRFSNSYYEFPIQPPGLAADTPLYTARCGLIGHVPRSFHDQLCVQGSGQLASGATVSFAVRDCACAEICPRTEQRICFEVLDPVLFPHGRGATGRAITPLVTVAVDPAVVPLGAVLFIPEFRGLARQDGAPHDGCFVAEDRGLRIKGHRLDVFAGDVATRRSWDGAVPHNHGVQVFIGDPRCGRAELLRAGADVQRTR